MVKIFRFKTKIPQNRMIEIPESAHLVNKNVEVIVLSNTKEQFKTSAKQFVEDWAGFMQDLDPDSLKSDYLAEKYK